ncbi:HAL/PAL/TAL family ammonia-lyase [Nocardia sp. MW-W600-9]
MPEVFLDGHNLTLEQVAGVAQQTTGRVELAESANKRSTASNAMKADYVAAGVPIYGVTSGFGDSSARQIPGRKAEALQQNLISFLTTGVGPIATPEVTRATLLIRANCLARGWSGVRPDLIELLIDCLNSDILPLIPELGSVGASGDLVPLSYIGAMLTGRGDVLHRGVRRSAASALAESGLEPLTMDAKEGLAIVNGTSFMAAFAALAVRSARRLATVSTICGALASQVLRGNPDHYSEFLVDQKPHRGSVECAAHMRALLERADARSPQLDRIDHPAEVRQLEHPLQDRYSVRCTPQIVGVLLDTLAWNTEWLTIEINSSNDNPLFDTESRRIWNGGNFYGGHVGVAMDSLKTAVASVGDMLDRQLELVVDEKFNNGLTPNLIPRLDPSDPRAGVVHGFKGMQITASALTAEALKATMPATSFSRSTEAHNQDKVSMGTIAARDARTVIDLVTKVAAIHLLALCQAADIRGVDVLTTPTRKVYTLVREVSSFVDSDRPLDGDIEAVAALIDAGAFEEVK